MVAPPDDVIESMRDLWETAGYGRTPASAFVVPPPSQNYKRLYHLTSAEYAISDIALCRLKVALLNQVNDPFEFLAAKLLKNGKLSGEVHRLRDQLSARVGLLCFSADWNDPVLWTHYASRHTGICLGFDVPTELAVEVRYQDDRIVVPGGEVDAALEKKLLSTKFSSWKYEREWRVLVELAQQKQEGSLHFQEIGEPIHLAEVILGANCTVSVPSVKTLVDTHHEDVVTFQARLALGSFDIVPKESTISENPSFVHVR